MEFKYPFYGLGKKIKSAKINGIIIDQILKLPTKVYSNLSNINIYNHLKF